MDSSPLLKLPAEIRNHIYELALYQERGIHIAHPRTCVRRNPLALARCCRRLYSECMRLFYNINSFTIYTTSSNVSLALEAFTSSLNPTNAAAMRTIRLVYGGFFPNAIPNPAMHRAISEHLMTIYLNLRNNTIIREYCIGDKLICVGVSYWVDDKVFTRKSPYTVVLDCRKLKTSMVQNVTSARNNAQTILKSGVPLTDMTLPLHFLYGVGKALGEIVENA